MTGRLITVAALALAAPLNAQADNVVIYGTLNMSLDFTEAKGATAPGTQSPGVAAGGVNADSTQQVSCSACNIGFRGEEDLGGGLKAWFQLESAIDPDEGSGTWTRRNSAVGLKGGWGTVLVGNWDTPHKKNIQAKSPFYTTTNGAYNSIFGTDGGAGNGATPASPFDNRQTNSIQYWSPKMAGGLKVNLLYSTRSDASAAAANNGAPGTAGEDSAWGASILWDAKNLYAGASYEQQDDVSATAGQSDDNTAYAFNFSYAFAGKYRVGAVWENIEYERGGTASDRDAYGIFGVLPLGPGAVHAWYIKADDWSGRPDSGADFWALGYYYDLSKRTKLYVQYAAIDNDRNARYRLGGSAGNRLIPDTGADPEAFNLGIRHSF